jgi:Uma2 family endonuclease
MLVRDRIYEELARAGNDVRLEVHDGKLREKPSMTFGHGDVSLYLGLQLGVQLDRTAFAVRVNHGRLRPRRRPTTFPMAT